MFLFFAILRENVCFFCLKNNFLIFLFFKRKRNKRSVFSVKSIKPPDCTFSTLTLKDFLLFILLFQNIFITLRRYKSKVLIYSEKVHSMEDTAFFV